MAKTEELPVVAKQNVDKDTRFARHKIYASGANSFFETWRVPEVEPDASDQFHMVESGEEGLRGITLISYKYYNRVDLWWFIAAINGIFCPTVEVVPGIELRIPSLQRMLKFIT